MQVPREKQVRITWRDLVRQAKADLWAKEVQTGYSVTYAWMANQLGHFTIGFGGSLFLLWVTELVLFIIRAVSRALHDLSVISSAVNWHVPDWSQFLFPLAVFGWIIYKEAGDVREARDDAKKSNLFPMDLGDVYHDALTAVGFVGIGAAVAGCSLLTHHWVAPLLLLVLVLCALPASHYWLTRKLCFQQADLPFIFRLANYPDHVNSPCRDQVVRGILGFVSLAGPWKHLVISGPLQSGKTLLASAIGTEHTFDLGRVRYFTLDEFLQIADLEKDPTSFETRPLWDWRESNIVILDDVDTLITYSGNLQVNDIVYAVGKLRNAPLLLARQTVWLTSQPIEKSQGWQSYLAQLFEVGPEQIGVVELQAYEIPLSRKKEKAAAKGLS